MSLYDADFHAWAVEQAQLLQRRSANELDWENLAEELADLGRSETKELYNRYFVLLKHLLKWAHQPERRSQSWRLTITLQRAELAKLLRRNPSLRSVEPEEFSDAFRTARLKAAIETKLPLDVFPIEPQFTLEQARSDEWWPGWTPSNDG